MMWRLPLSPRSFAPSLSAYAMGVSPRGWNWLIALVRPALSMAPTGWASRESVQEPGAPLPSTSAP